MPMVSLAVATGMVVSNICMATSIVSGLIALLLRIYSGRLPQDILDTPPTFVTALDFEQHLSATRSNGLSSMLSAIRTFATEALQSA
jgi:sulfur transfer protein SufE